MKESQPRFDVDEEIQLYDIEDDNEIALENDDSFDMVIFDRNPYHIFSLNISSFCFCNVFIVIKDKFILKGNVRLKRSSSDANKNKTVRPNMATSPGAGQQMGLTVVLNSEKNKYFMTSAFFEGFKVICNYITNISV